MSENQNEKQQKRQFDLAEVKKLRDYLEKDLGEWLSAYKFVAYMNDVDNLLTTAETKIQKWQRVETILNILEGDDE